MKTRGRPALPEGLGKTRWLPVRFRAEDLTRIRKASKTADQTVSAWVRSALMSALADSELAKPRNMPRIIT